MIKTKINENKKLIAALKKYHVGFPAAHMRETGIILRDRAISYIQAGVTPTGREQKHNKSQWARYKFTHTGLSKPLIYMDGRFVKRLFYNILARTNAVTINYSYRLRAAKIAKWLAEKGYTLPLRPELVESSLIKILYHDKKYLKKKLRELKRGSRI